MALVVVIEDDPATRKTLARVLRTGGYDAAIYGSAEEFLAAPPPSPPLGMLLDVHLGGMSGFELQGRLSREGSPIPVIIITAFDDTRARERAVALGCVAYLRKPCEAHTILGLLRDLEEGKPSGV
jgi:FixJ family two-component response regulator